MTMNEQTSVDDLEVIHDAIHGKDANLKGNGTFKEYTSEEMNLINYAKKNRLSIYKCEQCSFMTIGTVLVHEIKLKHNMKKLEV